MSPAFKRRRLKHAFMLMAVLVAALLLIGPLFGDPSNEPAAFPSSSEIHAIPTPNNPPPAAQWIQTIDPAIDSKGLTDKQVNQSIHRGVDFLLEHFDDGQLSLKGHPEMPRAWREGLDALCVYALLRAGLVTGDERLNVRGPLMSAALEKLDNAEMETDLNGKWGPVTYARGLRAMALAVYNRPEDRDTFKDDAAWLVGAEVLGGYFYDDRYAQGRGRLSDLPNSPTTQESPKPRLRQAGRHRHANDRQARSDE